MAEITVSEAQLLGWVQLALWPMFRIGGMSMTMPVIGASSTPMRVRLIFVLTLSLLIAPTLPPMPVIEPFTAAWWLRGLQEVLFGLALGFVLKLVFEAAMLAGDLIGNSMGLGFAQLVDPVRGAAAPVIGSFYTLLFSLLLLSTGGHLQLISLVARSLVEVPDPAAMLDGELLSLLFRFVAHSFAGGLQMAMPLLTALILINLGFGVMSRSAPALNALSVGFPLSLIGGLLMLWATLPLMPQIFDQLMRPGWQLIEGWTRAP